ncbi:hypothetical protein L2E82_15232 [Cichorium intybus]|uniref:Uncharacterized protein n=1 Tax=Cichorium intybus TaxID=13427 RepID=A0ACB9F1Q0_CICIN|nr:hypothetical protein L2E82_15232 [Cichorium intybus]
MCDDSVVCVAWVKATPSGTADRRLLMKFKAVKEELKAWRLFADAKEKVDLLTLSSRIEELEVTFRSMKRKTGGGGEMGAMVTSRLWTYATL